MLPTIKDDSLNVTWHAAEIEGRLRGVAEMPTLVATADMQAALVQSADAIGARVDALYAAQAACVLFEWVENRRRVGRGRGVDRGWDAGVAAIADKGRVSLPDRSTSNADYRAVFADGTIANFTKPTISNDPEVAHDFRARVADSKFPNREALLAEIDAMSAHVVPVAQSVTEGEQQVNELFSRELTARRQLVDTLWAEQKNVERVLGRSGRATARFIFFDYRTRKAAEAAPEEPAPPSPTEEPPR